MQNVEIRRTAAGAGVRLWQIAEAMGMTDSQFSRKLRREFSQEDKEKAFSVIRELSKEAR